MIANGHLIYLDFTMIFNLNNLDCILIIIIAGKVQRTSGKLEKCTISNKIIVLMIAQMIVLLPNRINCMSKMIVKKVLMWIKGNSSLILFIKTVWIK